MARYCKLKTPTRNGVANKSQNIKRNMWRRKDDSKDVEEIKISNISEVSKDDDEHNNAINKTDIHYEGKKDGDVK